MLSFVSRPNEDLSRVLLHYHEHRLMSAIKLHNDLKFPYVTEFENQQPTTQIH